MQQIMPIIGETGGGLDDLSQNQSGLEGANTGASDNTRGADDGVSGEPARDFTQLIPDLSLPTSGGAVRSIGEKFTLNPATGTGNISVPIAMASGRGAPEISLGYDSGGGNGPFGLGWSLGLASITRKTDRRLPTYTDEDVFILSG